MSLIPLLLKGKSLQVIWLKYNDLVYFYSSSVLNIENYIYIYIYMNTDALLRSDREAKINIRQGRMGKKETVHYTKVLSSWRNSNLPSIACNIGRQALEKTPCSKRRGTLSASTIFRWAVFVHREFQFAFDRSDDGTAQVYMGSRSPQQQLELSKGSSAPETGKPIT